MICIICFVLFVLQHSAVISEEYCSISIPTIEAASACPKNEIELLNAKGRKRCDFMANSQTCSEPNNFTYHCVLNTWMNATIEVCAPEIYSQGYCVRFDKGGARLQEIYEKDCTHFLKPCSTRFLSSDVLHYVQCTENITNITNTENSTVNDENRLTIYLLVALAILVIAVAVIGFVVYHIYHRKMTDRTTIKELKERAVLLEQSNGVGQNDNQNMKTAQVNGRHNVGKVIPGSQDHSNNENKKSNHDVTIDNIVPDQSDTVGRNQRMESAQVIVEGKFADWQIPIELEQGSQNLTNKGDMKSNQDVPIDDKEPLNQSNTVGRYVNPKMEFAQVIVDDLWIEEKELSGSQDAAHNIKNFEEVMQKFSIDFVDILLDNDVKCLDKFCSMTEEQFGKMGLNFGQKLKCIQAAKELRKPYTFDLQTTLMQGTYLCTNDEK